jgi:5'-3' exoribonuclease 2
MAAQALAGSNRDVVANRRAIRMANMSAADVLKAELSGLSPVKLDLSLPPKPVTFPIPNSQVHTSVPQSSFDTSELSFDSSNEVPGLGNRTAVAEFTSNSQTSEPMKVDDDIDADAEGEIDPDAFPANDGDGADESLTSVKRKHDNVEDEPDESLDDEDDAPADAGPLALKVNADGTVEQEDTVKCVIPLLDLIFFTNTAYGNRLWEPGYKERYYRQKFGIESSDTEFRKK